MNRQSALLAIYDKLLERFGKQYWWPADTQEEIIIGAVLTQNTNWHNVVKALDNLKREGLCNLKGIAGADRVMIALLIKPSGYYNLKAERLQAVSQALTDFSPDSLTTTEARKMLLQIKGVGEETADSILLYVYNRPVFVIDAYTKRILDRVLPGKRLPKYKDYQDAFHQSLSYNSELFNEYHALLVRLGKAYCRKRPLCSECPLSRDCPSAIQDGLL